MTRQDRLWDDLQQARQEFLEAAKATTALAVETPSGIPAPDGSFRMAQASMFQRLAFEKYRESVARYVESVKTSPEK